MLEAAPFVALIDIKGAGPVTTCLKMTGGSINYHNTPAQTRVNVLDEDIVYTISNNGLI